MDESAGDNTSSAAVAVTAGVSSNDAVALTGRSDVRCDRRRANRSCSRLLCDGARRGRAGVGLESGSMESSLRILAELFDDGLVSVSMVK